MKTGKWMLGALVWANLCAASELSQKYEKAYYLETAKGQMKDAAALYQSIADEEPTAENKAAIKKSLLRLLHIGTARKHQPTILDARESLLTKGGATIQELVDLTAKGATLQIPAGEFEGPIVLNKDITLKGAGEATVLTATADAPLINVAKKVEAALEGLTLKARRETSDRVDPPSCTVYVKDAKATLQNCSVIAPDNIQRCPLGVLVTGFSEVSLIDSHFEGHANPIIYAEGTKGAIQGCIVRNPSDCGFTSHANSEVTIEGNIFAGSAKHGIRCTGGTIHVRDNLIIKNRSRGFYLGNKTSHGEIINNAIIENGRGVNTHASCDIEIENNVIYKNTYTGVDTPSYGRIQVKNNIIAENEKAGFMVYEKGNHKFKVGKNTFWGNGVPAQDYKLPSSTLEENSNFANAANGDFTPENKAVKSTGHGLTNPAAIKVLWEKYKELEK